MLTDEVRNYWSDQGLSRREDRDGVATFRRDARPGDRARAVALNASPAVERAARLRSWAAMNTCSMWWRSVWLAARGDRERRPKQ